MSKFKFSINMKNPLPSKKEIELYDPRKHGVRQSMLSTWLTCREQARLQTIHGWKTAGASVPFIYGTLSHGVLKCVYRGLRDSRIPDLKCVHDGLSLFMHESELEWLKEIKTPTTAQKDIKEDSCAILMKKLPFYFSRWWDEDSSVKWSMVEDKFMIPIEMGDGEVVPLIGTFDATYYTKSGDLWLFETKNKARWPDNIGTFLPLDLQVGIYLTALKTIYKKTPVGVRYNLLRRPGEKRKKEETLAEYSDRIAANVEKDPDHYFQRLEVELTDTERNEHVDRTTYLVEQFYEWWKETMLHPSTRDLMWNSGACENKYGVCSMLDACANSDFSGYRREPHAEAKGMTSHE